MTLPSQLDIDHMPLSRQFIDDTRQIYFEKFCVDKDLILDVGNQGKNIPGRDKYKVVTLDITSKTKPDIVGDITIFNKNLADNSFDGIMCTEVLEHVVDPFAAIRELRRLVKVGGCILITTPLNARIHGPIPDCWRFTEFGLNVLLRDFEVLYFNKLDTPGRNLFPLHYGAVVRKIDEKTIETDPRKMQFQPIA